MLQATPVTLKIVNNVALHKVTIMCVTSWRDKATVLDITANMVKGQKDIDAMGVATDVVKRLQPLVEKWSPPVKGNVGMDALRTAARDYRSRLLGRI